MKASYLVATAAAASIASAASAQSYSTGFETAQGFTTGSVAAGANEGNTNWQAASNGSTNGSIVSGIAHTGNQSLAIGNNGSGNDGVIQGVRSPELLVGAGETQSGAAFNQFNSSFWFRSGDWQPGSDYFASINAWSTDRMTWVALDYTGGVFSVYASGMNGTDTSTPPDYGFLPDAGIYSGSIVQGAWYRLDQSITFVNSANGGDDAVTFRLYDAANNFLGGTTTTSWDDGYLGSDRFYPTATLTPVNQLNFRTAYTTPGTGFYIDDVSYSVGQAATAGVPEPATWSMLILGFGMIGGALRRRRTSVAFG